MSIIDKFQSLKNHIELTQEDANKANTGNKAACVRLRKRMQVVKQLAQDVRLASVPVKK